VEKERSIQQLESTKSLKGLLFSLWLCGCPLLFRLYPLCCFVCTPFIVSFVPPLLFRLYPLYCSLSFEDIQPTLTLETLPALLTKLGYAEGDILVRLSIQGTFKTKQKATRSSPLLLFSSSPPPPSLHLCTVSHPSLSPPSLSLSYERREERR